MWSPKLPRGAFCAVVHAHSGSADESGDRGCLQPLQREVAGSNPQSSDPRSAQSLAIGAREST
eukprot:1152177-Alexandrium_andersonii.AAC.1